MRHRILGIRQECRPLPRRRRPQGNATAESSADIGNKSTQYDALGLPSTITDAMGQATQIQRDVLGRPTLITFADGKTTTLGYDSGSYGRGYLTSITDRSGTTTFSRDLFGRVHVKTQVLANGLRQQIWYGHNAAGQLAGIYYPGGNKNLTGSMLFHDYDATGRLVQLSWNGSPLVTGIAWNPMGQPTAWNWAFAPGMAASRSYDTAGRMTANEFASYVYDAAGRITSPTTRYAHNALGQRVFKTEPLYPPAEGDESDPGFLQGLVGFFTKLWGPSASDAEKLGYAFMYDEDGTLLAETGMGGANSAGSTQYIYLPTASGPMPIAAVINGQLYAVHSDHLNTPRRLTDSTGQPVWQWTYSAFGDEAPAIAGRRFANVAPGPGDFEFNLRYWGMYVDKESGLYDNRNRTYCPTCGRYTQPDRIGLGGGWNRFPYANLNPLRYGDPLGLWSVELGGYLGVGFSGAFGQDPSTGRGFVTGKFGAGLGGGFQYDPLGGRPGGGDGDSSKRGGGVGFFGEAGLQAGPVSGKLEANIGRNFHFGDRDSELYRGLGPKGSLGADGKWGYKGGASCGVEWSIF